MVHQYLHQLVILLNDLISHLNNKFHHHHNNKSRNLNNKSHHLNNNPRILLILNTHHQLHVLYFISLLHPQNQHLFFIQLMFQTQIQFVNQLHHLMQIHLIIMSHRWMKHLHIINNNRHMLIKIK